MKVLDLSGQRFDVAVNLLGEGGSFEFSDVRFFIDQENQELLIYVTTQWQLANLNEQIAMEELEKGKEIYAHLLTISEEFATTVDGLSPRFSLISDYGTGVVEVCYLKNEQLVWTCEK